MPDRDDRDRSDSKLGGPCELRGAKVCGSTGSAWASDQAGGTAANDPSCDSDVSDVSMSVMSVFDTTP